MRILRTLARSPFVQAEAHLFTLLPSLSEANSFEAMARPWLLACSVCLLWTQPSRSQLADTNLPTEAKGAEKHDE